MYVGLQYWRWESFPCLTVSHKFPRDTLCTVVIRSISEHFCDYHGTWLSPRYNHRNFQTWVITTELSGHDVSCGNLWDTVRHGKLSHRQYCMSSILIIIQTHRLCWNHHPDWKYIFISAPTSALINSTLINTWVEIWLTWIQSFNIPVQY